MKRFLSPVLQYIYLILPPLTAILSISHYLPPSPVNMTINDQHVFSYFGFECCHLLDKVRSSALALANYCALLSSHGAVLHEACTIRDGGSLNRADDLQHLNGATTLTLCTDVDLGRVGVLTQ